MRAQNYVFIVCALRSRSGTTTTARLLADYFLKSGRAFRGFDTDPHESDFAQFFPADVVIADIATVQGQMALFDSLVIADGVPKIVDIWSRARAGFFDIAAATDFFAEAARRNVTPFLFFMADGSEQSVELAQTLKARWPEVDMAVALNEGAAPVPDVLDCLERYPASYTIEIPPLDPVVRRVIENPEFSISRFLDEPPQDMSIIIRAGLRHWVLQVFRQFQSFEFRLTFRSTEYFG